MTSPDLPREPDGKEIAMTLEPPISQQLDRCKMMLTGSDPIVRYMVLDELRHTYNAVNLRCHLGRWVDPPLWLRRLQSFLNT